MAAINETNLFIYARKQLAVVEDIDFGLGKVWQERNGKKALYTRVNASWIPYDEHTSIAGELDTMYKLDGSRRLEGTMNAAGHNISHLGDPKGYNDAVNLKTMTDYTSDLYKLDGSRLLEGDMDANNHIIGNLRPARIDFEAVSYQQIAIGHY